MSTLSEIATERGGISDETVFHEALSDETGSGELGRRPGGARGVAVRAIRAYQLARAGRPSPCRFVPSCSEYASEAMERHGLGRGGLLALRRVLRCHPWGRHGLDPVPERRRSR